MSLLAIDIGSSRCKGMLFSSEGEVLAQSTRSYGGVSFSGPSTAEIHPDVFLDAVREVSCSISRPGDKDGVEAICLSSHGETLVPVDAAGEPLRAAILNMDGRAGEEANWCEAQIGRTRLFEITGHVSHAVYPVPKLLWLRKHEPGLFQKSTRFLNVTSYIFQRLGLPPYIDYSLASRYMAFDIHRQCWSKEILSLLGISKDAFPIPVPAGTAAGTTSPEAARQLGLPVGIPVVVGGHDQACGSVGAGVIEAGRVFDSMGTYESIAVTSDAPYISQEAMAHGLNTYCHVIPGKFITLAYFPSGIMVQWFSDLLCSDRTGDASEEPEAERFSMLERLAPSRPSGLLVIPHLIGTCDSDSSPALPGVVVGLTAGSHRGHIYKGILEGIACELSILTTAFDKILGPFTDIYAAGGGTQSPLGIRLRAAMTERRFHLMGSAESVCLGTAILAGVAIGRYDSIPKAVEQMVQEREVLDPDRSLTRTYLPVRKRYEQLKAALRTMQLSSQNEKQESGVEE